MTSKYTHTHTDTYTDIYGASLFLKTIGGFRLEPHVELSQFNAVTV